MDDFKMPDLGGLMQAAKRMQTEMARVQEELAERRVEASAGGGMVTVVANGRMEILEVKIDPEAVDPNDVGMLQDLVAAGVNQAIAKSRELAQAEFAKVTGGLGMAVPGLTNLV